MYALRRADTALQRGAMALRCSASDSHPRVMRKAQAVRSYECGITPKYVCTKKMMGAMGVLRQAEVDELLMGRPVVARDVVWEDDTHPKLEKMAGIRADMARVNKGRSLHLTSITSTHSFYATTTTTTATAAAAAAAGGSDIDVADMEVLVDGGGECVFCNLVSYTAGAVHSWIRYVYVDGDEEDYDERGRRQHHWLLGAIFS